jgi:hypothetical protein|tara:strand:+ start:191 stop:484 length:294 start_codon:yes stop_codon:yes gene_type:complete
MRVIIDNTIEMTEEKISDVFLVTKEFHTTTEFSQFIEKMAFNSDTGCLDILTDYCIKREIEVESVSKFLTASLKNKIKQEALELNLLKEKKKSSLPL